MKAGIKAISYVLPEKIFSNEEFFTLFPELRANANLNKIGVEERRIVESTTVASDLAIKAGKKFFAEHPEIIPSDIDFLLYCAQERDYYTPSTGCYIQKELGLSSHCGSVDFNLGCSGYVYGLSLAKGLVESIGNKNVLFLTSSVLTKTIHPRDKASRFLFGDAASATLISTEAGSIGEFVLGTDGKSFEKIIIRHGEDRHPVTENSFIEKPDEFGNISTDANFFMDGTGVFLFSIRKVPEMIKQVLEKSNLALSDIDLFILHQANTYIIDTIRKKLEQPEEKFFNFMKTCGNTVSASIPIALTEAIKAGKAKKGQKILLAGFGVGLSWSCTIITL